MTNRLERNPVSTLERAFDVVEYRLEAETATLTEVADTLDIAKSTAHRHLRTLEHRAYVVRQYETFIWDAVSRPRIFSQTTGPRRRSRP